MPICESARRNGQEDLREREKGQQNTHGQGAVALL